MTADMLLDDRERRQDLRHAAASAADLADLMEVQAFGRGLVLAMGLSTPTWAAFVFLTLR